MPTSKRPQKGTTRKVPPKPHSPPAAPDVAKKGRKAPRICEDIPWSPSKVVRQKLAPPDTTIDLTHLKETSPPSSSNQAFAAASMLLSLVTVPTSVAAAASTWELGQGELVTFLGFRQAGASHHKHGGEDNNYRPRQRIHCSRKGDHSPRCSIHVLVSSSQCEILPIFP